MTPFRLFSVVLAISLASLPMQAQGYDCNNPDKNDAYAICVCDAYNAFNARVLKCKTASCIGAARIKLTSDVANCSRFDVSSGEGWYDSGYWMEYLLLEVPTPTSYTI